MKGRVLTLWDVHEGGLGGVQQLSTEQVREQLYRGQLHAENWAKSGSMSKPQQLGTIDEFEDTVASGRRRRRPIEDDAGLEMTSMIDITFLLLIFFMVTASFHLEKGLTFPPGKTENDNPKKNEPIPGVNSFVNHIIVEIDNQDRISLRRTGIEIEHEKIAHALKQESQTVRKHKLMIVANELSSHEAVVAIISGAGLANISDVTVADVTTQRLNTTTSGQPLQIQRNPPADVP